MKIINLIQKKIELLPQEYSGKYKFNGHLVMTQEFAAKFGDMAIQIAINAIAKIINERGSNADYLQVCKYEGIKFWVIDDIDTVTVLLPKEY